MRKHLAFVTVKDRVRRISVKVNPANATRTERVKTIPTNKIGTLNEGDLHLRLKHAYAGFEEGSLLEQPINGFVADVVCGDVIYEVQTSSFGKLRQKLPTLLQDYRVVVVYPIMVRKFIVKHFDDGSTTRRKSPVSENLFDLFRELTYIPAWLEDEGFEIEAVFVDAEEHRVADRKRGWRRRGWVIQERRLLEIHDRRRIKSMSTMFDLIAPLVPEEFSSKDLALALQRTRRFGQRAAYCLRKAGVTEICNKQGNELIYRRAT